MNHPIPRCVMVTGAGGNLGHKVVEALARTDWCELVVGIDRSGDYSKFSDVARKRLRLVQGDLTLRSGEWTRAMEEVDAVIHFAALNPVPDSSWPDSLASYEMTSNLLMECVRAGVGRFVFASSNHTMGAYKDMPLAAKMGPGRLTTRIATAPGTKWHDGTRELHSLAYGTAKVMGEKQCAAVAELSGGKLSTVSVRVGWALTGENRARDITHSGSPASTSDVSTLDDEARRALRWFRNMWLSNRDLDQLFIRSVLAPSDQWPSQAIIVNGVSNNEGMDWDLSDATAYLGYHPEDDAYRDIARS
ncbi:NAD-dependent epimerase/dehydratase family protein [Paraburkholderia acidisoli]|uniref:NAD-dependent epimerase/dehydratase family protein n=1 Tax=Paraburkholderia acidisoli TaxID=2571748 RepID=A0A7Z2GQS2_9BURK|nr:NAD(P)-dependent oxidoreductase [Paraburkholderia acidisoli]QGZ66198.1 NAD-dependent epimerase/dehydratase family protein [Paraburkholderia acidisoli]